jgi:hypothetical protein
MLAIVALAYAGWQGWKAGVPAYKRWKQQRALAQAKDFIDKRDPQNAKMALDVALATAPGNVEAWRMAATLLEQVGAPQAMKLRRQVTLMAPDSAEDAAALVMCALQFRDLNSARDALSAMTPELAQQRPALQAALAYALTVDDKAVADLLLDTLKQQTPDNEQLRLTQAFLRLRHPREDARDAARGELLHMAAANPRVASLVYREFGAQEVRARNYPEAKKWFAKLMETPDAAFEDQLQVANIALLVDGQPFATVFAGLAPKAAASPQAGLTFLQWLLVQRKADEAERWLATLPKETLQMPRYRAVLGDIAIQRKDWPRLEQLLREGALGDIKAETVQLAFSAKALDAAGKTNLRREIWQVALESTQRQLPPLTILRRIAAAWDWDEEADSTLWAITNSYPDQTWAYQALMASYRANKNTRGLQNVLSVLRQNNPGVARYDHDWALLTLLIEPNTTWTPAKELLKQLHAAAPTQPNYTTGYAFALAQANRGDEAMAVLKKLSDVERTFPPRLPLVAYVYGVARAKTEFAAVEQLAKDVDYLPEERQLFMAGREALERKPVKFSTGPERQSAPPAPASRP